MNHAADADYEAIWSGGWDDMRLYGPMARHSRRLHVTSTSAVIIVSGGGVG